MTTSCDRLSPYKIQQLKERIEKFDKVNQVEVLQILHRHNVMLNENKNGVLVNLSEADDNVICELERYVAHLETQEKMLKIAENEKETYRQMLSDSEQNR